MSRHDDAIRVRDEELAALTIAARELLEGRRVVDIYGLPHDESCDSPNVLRLALDDGTAVDIVGGYGGYSGSSCDEYVEYVTVRTPTPPPSDRERTRARAPGG